MRATAPPDGAARFPGAGSDRLRVGAGCRARGRAGRGRTPCRGSSHSLFGGHRAAPFSLRPRRPPVRCPKDRWDGPGRPACRGRLAGGDGPGPAGPALVGPAEGSEDIWGSYLAAAEGAAAAGRAVYLLDPPPEGLPVPSAGEFAALFLWIPEDEFPAGLAAARSRRIPAGCLLPLLPGWTASAEIVREAVTRAAAAGASFLAPLFPSEQGDARGDRSSKRPPRFEKGSSRRISSTGSITETGASAWEARPTS